MKEFTIQIRSFEDVQEFVSLATVQPFRVLVGNDRYRVSGKSFMGMFSLDCTEPLKVRMSCTEEEYESFRRAAGRFLV